MLGAERVLGGDHLAGSNAARYRPRPSRRLRADRTREAAGRLTERAQAIAALLSGAGIEARAADASRPLVWGKLIANAAINPLGALLRCLNGQTAERPSSENAVRGAGG